MNDLKKKRLELLKEEIFLVSVEEKLQKAGEFYEARSVREERKNVNHERMALERRIALRVVV
jgi:hypothetical protein